jgi:hypothetical protein
MSYTKTLKGTMTCTDQRINLSNTTLQKCYHKMGKGELYERWDVHNTGIKLISVNLTWLERVYMTF